MNWFRKHGYLSFVLALSLGVWGCGDDENPTDPGGGSNETAPDLPPLASMTFAASELAFFEAAPKSATGEHWGNAAVRAVLVWGAASLTVAAPAALFGAIVNADPEPARQSDGSWIWSHTASNGGIQYQVIGDPGQNMVDWTFQTIVNPSGENAETRVWFTGLTSDGGTAATWTFFAADMEGAPAAGRVEYEETSGGKTLRFTDLYEEAGGGETLNDALTFTLDGDARSIDFDDGQSDDIWFIEWNESTQIGSIQVPEYNGGEKGCWDELLQDVDCPIAKGA